MAIITGTLFSEEADKLNIRRVMLQIDQYMSIYGHTYAYIYIYI
jgi:chorismate-pyruvate lyase